MNIWWPSIAIGLLPLATCYAVFPWFRAAVNRRLTFKAFDYDALDDILSGNMPERLRIKCLQASYSSNDGDHTHVDIYPYKENTAVIRIAMDDDFPIARMFRDVLINNITALCLKGRKLPLITINQSTYQVLGYQHDNYYLHIYVEHK
ncbi:hypothetical protein HOU09_gp261 [Dickeya phage vB_DsoM_AD1]|uniref:Uncharacterized protein n=1 Tax=Dickeya phage vB_DsoM_AD1 TaxID=2283029 RepID=A0A384ZYK5_9CAUD|nr:hypothetical protein HOU09_gp261 [Dickeya phage vB_DsoM_AD1]AXG67305.1 hypothetical protein AD1_261 [Dickeya phage vB_DsoM_AD1]